MRKKFKYQGGLTKQICRRIAEYHKRAFIKNWSVLKALPTKENSINFEIISFCGGSVIEDQIISIYSMLYYGGTPKKWTVYSDGSISEAQAKILEDLFSFVSVKRWDEYKIYEEVREVTEYLSYCPLAKKINIILGHPYQLQTIYIDSDILFYKNFSAYLQSGVLDSGLWFAPDAIGDVTQYFIHGETSMFPLNSGLLLLNKEFIAEDVYEYLRSLKGDYGYFSEQSSFEYAFRKQKASMLDPRQFVIDTADQFEFSYRYYPEDIAMRHYTGPVRHKMWQKNWKWHFV